MNPKQSHSLKGGKADSKKKKEGKIMKKTEKFVVIRNKENGHFLAEYKSNDGTFAYSAGWVDFLQNAAANTVESVEKQNEKVQKLAEALGGELLLVNATYELTTLDGEDAKGLTEEIEEAKRKHLVNLLNGLFSDNDDEED